MWKTVLSIFCKYFYVKNKLFKKEHNAKDNQTGLKGKKKQKKKQKKGTITKKKVNYFSEK